MSVSGYVSKSRAQLRMPRSEPGVRDPNGFVFHGPVLTGRIDVATAIRREALQAWAASYTPAAGGPLVSDPVLDPLANRIPPAPDPASVAPFLDSATPPNEARSAPNAVPLSPAFRPSGPPAAAEASRVLDRFRDPSRR